MKVDFDLAPFRQEVSKFVKKQIPFATSLAVNRTAEKAKQALRTSVSRTFTERSKFVRNGIKRTRATKRDPTSAVGSQDDFMRLQAVGGIKKKGGGKGGRIRKGGPGGGSFMAIPVIGGPARKTIAAKTTPRKWPSRLGATSKKKPFIVTFKSGKRALVRRKKKARLPLEVIYFFHRSVKIPKRWNFLDIVEASVRENWAREAVKALEEALKTGR